MERVTEPLLFLTEEEEEEEEVLVAQRGLLLLVDKVARLTKLRQCRDE